MEINSVDAAVNTNPLSQIAVLNTDKLKKKPYDVKIKNYNPNEPKIKANMKYSDTQNFRRYKTKTEPKLFSKIMVDDEEELISKIRKEFGIKDTTKKNYSEVETSGIPYYEAPNPKEPEIVNQQQPRMRERPVRQQPQIRQQSMVNFDELTDMTRKDIEDILGGIIEEAKEAAVGLTLASGEDIGDVDDDEPSIPRIYTNQEIDKFTPDELNRIAVKQGIAFTGPKPKKTESKEKRAEEIRNMLRSQNKSTETSVIVEK